MIRKLLFFILSCSTALAIAHDHAHGRAAAIQFHQNLGQWPAPVLFRAMTPGGAVFVEPTSFTHVRMAGGVQSVHGKPGAVPERYREHAYRIHFEGSQGGRAHGTDREHHYVNYFLGNDQERWASGVPVFGGVELDEVYPGIDLHVSGMHGLKYDWVLAPGADPERIVLRFEGADELVLEGGVLRVKTSAGDVIEQRPMAWQEMNGSRVPVPVAYALEGSELRYALPNGHDARFALVIDPVVVFCTYSGSSAPNYGTTATYDEGGHLYGAGTVFNVGYPTTPGVIQSAYGGTDSDMGISKFSPDGDELIWCTYLGGALSEVPHSMVVNSANELYVMGTTASADFPTTPGCHDATFGGGSTPPFGGSYGVFFPNGSDIVVAHLNNGAISLIGSTYVGGTENDGLNQSFPLLRNYGDPFRGEIILDAAQSPVIATSTASSDMFVSTNATQTIFGGALDAYIFKADPALSTLVWATYHGGTDLDAGLGVQVSSAGDIYLTGGTMSSDLPAVGTSAQATFSGAGDGYIARFNAVSNALDATTFIGTSAFDQSYFVQLDLDDNVYVVGQTTGAFPVSPGVYSNPNASQFIQKFSNDLDVSIWSTRIGGGGSENISPSAFLVSNCGQIYFSGWGGSTNSAGGGVTSSSTIGLFTTTDAFQSTTDGSDFYLIVLQPDAAGVDYASFFGGSSAEHVDGGTSRFDKDGIVYQAVCAGCSGSFPTTPGAYAGELLSTNCNLGVIKLNFEQGVQAFIDAETTDLLACTDSPFLFNAEGNAVTYTWDFGDGAPQEQGTSVTHTYEEGGVYTITLIGSDPSSCNLNDTAFAEVTVVEPSLMDPRFDAIPAATCDGYSVELFNLSTGSTQFIWDLGDATGSTLTNPVHVYAGPGTYQIVLGVLDPVCVDTVYLAQTITLEPATIEFIGPPQLALCDGLSATIDAGSGFDSYLWSTGQQTQQIVVDEPGEYIVTVTDGFCQGADTVIVQPTPAHAPIADVTTCVDASVELTPPYPVQQIQWSTGSSSAVLQVATEGEYWFVGIDEFGCPVTDTVQVLIASDGRGVAFIPNVFTPNGDGQNDTFQVVGLAIDEFRMEVYDRWGLKMYETTSLQKGWNGGVDNRSGDAVPDGSYYYIIDMKDRCAAEPGAATRTGHITLLR